ncbi:response regulator [Phenylobacterium sp.]|uniref:response regulator n=1 Tax=Phenylobacterium sp. TaxID=1871053 RepID=UPI0035262021
MVTTSALAEEGYDVAGADGADHALEVLRRRSDVGVLSTDVNMPGRFDGLGLTRRAHERWPKVHIGLVRSRRRSMASAAGSEHWARVFPDTLAVTKGRRLEFDEIPSMDWLSAYNRHLPSHVRGERPWCRPIARIS